MNNSLFYYDPTGYKWDWNWINPVYWMSEGMQWLNDNTTGLREKMADIGIPNFNVGYNTTQGSFHNMGNSGNIYHNQLGNDYDGVVNAAIGDALNREAYVSENSSLGNAAPRNEDINLGNIFAGVTIAKEAGQALYRINSKELHNLQNILEANHEINSIKINDQLLKVVRAGKIIKRIGFVGNVANLGAIGYDIMEQNGEVTTENAIDGAFGVVSFVPNVGWIISSVYSLNKEASKTGYYFSGDLILW